MDLDFIKSANIIEGRFCIDGKVIRPALGIDGDIALFYDDVDIVNYKIKALKDTIAMLSGKKSAEGIKVIPLYKKLCAKDCRDVMYMAMNYTNSGFIKELEEVFYSEKLEDWVRFQKEKKHFN